MDFAMVGKFDLLIDLIINFCFSYLVMKHHLIIHSIKSVVCGLDSVRDAPFAGSKPLHFFTFNLNA